MKFKLLRRRLSISAPRMTVRTHLPWPLRAARIAAIVVVSVLFGLWLYHSGKQFSGGGQNENSDELARLQEQLQQLTLERDHLSAASNAAESRLNIERSAQQQLASEVKTLELENAQLKEDLAFFQNLSADSATVGVSIKRLQVIPDAIPRQLRYRMLVTQGGKTDHDFSGELQLILTLQQAGKTVIINLPEGLAGDEAKPYHLSFRIFQRLDGTFRIPENATLKQVQARILEGGTVRAQQILVLK